MNLDANKTRALDAALEAYAEELRDTDEVNAAAMLAYTHSLHRSWRTALQMLPIPAEWSVLDVGSGLGILAFELAANLPIRVDGVDIDPSFVGHARRLLDRLAAEALIPEPARVGFTVGDISALEFAEASFDLVFARELLQFLAEPVGAVRELLRILRPGGYACVSDTDDQLRITWPPPSPALTRLVDAVASVQHERGGDRQIGRKLTTYLRTAGFEINSVIVLPEAQHRVVDEGDRERTLIVEQLNAVRNRVLDAGVMEAERFDADLAELAHETAFEEFRLNGRIVVMARKPAR